MIFLAFFIAYLLGSIPAAVWICQLAYGQDIRTLGSGNAGSTNVYRNFGWKTGVLVQIIDILKSVASVYLLEIQIFEPTQYKVLWQLSIGLCSVIGHIYPIFAGFKGGKGINSLLGMMLAIDPMTTSLCALVFIITFLSTGIVSVGSMLAAIFFPIFQFLKPYFLTTASNDYFLAYFGIIIAALVIYTHRANIQRLKNGTESRFNIWNRKKNMKFILIIILCVLMYFVWFFISHYKTTSDEYSNYGVKIPEHRGVIGIDISHYQQDINWHKVKKFKPDQVKISFVFMKATESENFVDPQFLTHWQHTFDLGIKRGAYHFFSPDDDALVQAKHFLKYWKPDSYTLPPVLDVEKMTKLKPVELKKKIKIWMEYVEKMTKIKPILYTYKHYFELYELSDLHYPIWIAYYNSEKPTINKHDWKFWQFSEKATVNGISTPVDLNIFNGDSASFEDWTKRMTEKIK